jgi:TP53 regulating kinase-like protein
MVDAADGVLGIEWIEGESVRHLLPGGAQEEEAIPEQDFENEEDDESGDLADPLKDYGISVGGYHSTCSSFFFSSKNFTRCLDGSHWH